MHIKEAAEKLGVSAITLKRWFLMGRIAEVPRDRNNWRVFNESDLDRIRTVILQEDETDLPKTGLLTIASFFSGIGGFELGFERAGFQTTMQCEIEPFCNLILEKHWPSVKRFKDIREITSDAIPAATVWVGGFPCQDLSLARMGKREGLKGSKSGLFHEFARLVGERLPRILVIENVAGLLSSHQGKDFAVLLGTLAELGYALGWRTLNSKNFGVPQSRQRVYIIGCYRDGRGPGEILFEPECGKGHPAACESDKKKPTPSLPDVIGDPRGSGPVIQSIAYCLYATSARHTGTDWSRNYVCYPAQGRIRRLIPSECEAVMAFPNKWTVPKSNTIQGEALDSARYHALGNAVTPPVAEWLAKRISAYLYARK